MSTERTTHESSSPNRTGSLPPDHFDGGWHQLVVIVCIPLVNGIFPSLLVAGHVQTLAQMIVIALTIFTGAGALTVLYTHADSRQEAWAMVTPTAIALLVGALLTATIAPVFETIFAVSRLELVTGVVILSYAGSFLGIPGATKVPTNAVLLLGFGLSLQNPGAIGVSTLYLKPALLTALIAIGGLYLAASIHPAWISVSTMRTGGGVVLTLIGMSVMGVVIPSTLSLGVFGATLAAAMGPKVQSEIKTVIDTHFRTV